MQTKEHLSQIDIPQCTNATDAIDFAKNKPFNAYKLSIFGGISYTIERPNHSWRLSFDGSGTIARSGIGPDFMFVLKAECHY